jgi:hypothetical protein
MERWRSLKTDTAAAVDLALFKVFVHFFNLSHTYIETAYDYDIKSENSDPEGQVGLDDEIDMPPEYINEFEKDFVFVIFQLNIHHSNSSY